MFLESISMLCILACCVSAAATDLETHFISQHFINGTTAVQRKHESSSISMHFNEPRPLQESIPLLNYSNTFNLGPNQASNREESLNTIYSLTTVIPAIVSSSSSLSPPTVTNNVSEFENKRQRQECADDKVELDFLHYKSISLESNLTRLTIDYNFTILKYEECKVDRLNLEKKLNYTVDAWSACKRFCETK